MENFFLTFGIGWVTSKIIPFLLMLILGIGLYFIVLKILQNKWMRLSSLVLIVLPTLTYLVFNPIYQGDFTDNYRTEKITSRLYELEDERLTILVLPGCPYCEEAIEQMNSLRARIGSEQEMDIIVCTADKNDLKFYKKKSKGQMNVKISKNTRALSELAEREFPSFVFRKKGKRSRVWSNFQFGAFAKDWVEEHYE
jgi:glutaredoxin